MRSKILGCLYSQALGDAFAMPAQVHPDDTERAFGWLDSWQAAPADHIVHAGLPAGRITDDSEQAFSIAQAVIDAGGVTLEAAVKGLAAWAAALAATNRPPCGP
ncbi:MAG: ADP-ribosylglycohydrolase family protein, partial [Chloroflexi bacterium]|nr:ADP-ribosylglycohydrolase family protein [Chloroflexota bacterium]